MKKSILITVIVLLVLTAGAFVAYKAIESNLKSLETLEIPDVDLSAVEDGAYGGSYSAFPVAVEVSVTVKDHVITDIQIIKHRNGQGAPAEVIPEKVIKAQSLQVDTVAGATYSSNVILSAIENALLGTKR